MSSVPKPSDKHPHTSHERERDRGAMSLTKVVTRDRRCLPPFRLRGPSRGGGFIDCFQVTKQKDSVRPGRVRPCPRPREGPRTLHANVLARAPALQRKRRRPRPIGQGPSAEAGPDYNLFRPSPNNEIHPEEEIASSVVRPDTPVSRLRGTAGDRGETWTPLAGRHGNGQVPREATT